MKSYQAIVNIMPHPEILDPKGKATEKGLHNLGFTAIEQVRIGKRITFNLKAANPDEARAMAEDACRKLLVNAIMEGSQLEIIEM